MKKYRKYLILLAIVLSVFGIYYVFSSKEINYIALGDSLVEGRNPYGEISYSYTDYLRDILKETKRLNYYQKYAQSGYQTSDMIAKIQEDNQLKKDLRESDLVTISIGANDFLGKIDISNLSLDVIKTYKNTIEGIFPDVEECIKEIRKYAKENLIIIGYYNPIPFLFNTSQQELDELFAYIDDEYQKIAKEYNAIYISNYQLFKENKDFLPNPLDIHPNSKGYQEIAEIIMEYLETNKVL
ncbi:MAG TPA: SGNH/GDSL hydrolase family protein [Candidatus Scybalousia intestinigallinarum]|nr:SGNH/GDSL hydrolase family protein [Candidatus Scybalousia intestinigallinarum]